MSVRRHLVWVGLSQALYLSLQFASSVFIARLLSPYEVGIYAVALAVVGLIGIFQEFGLFGFVIREPEMTPQLSTTTFTINLILSLILSALIAGFSVLGGSLLKAAGVRQVMLVLAISPLIGCLSFLPETYLQRHARFGSLAVISILRTITSQGLAVILALRGYSYMSLAYSQLAAALLGLVCYSIVGRDFISIRVGLFEWRRVTKFGINMFAIAGVTSIADRATDFILGRTVGLAPLGIYSRAANLNNIVWENIHLVSGKVLFVDLAATKRSGQSLRESYIRINDINTVLLWPAFVGLATVSGPFIVAVYGRKWVSASQPLCFLALASMIYVSLSMTWDMFVLAGRTAQQAKIEYYRTGFSVCAFAIGCAAGLTGAAASRVLTALVSNELYRPHMNKITDTSFEDFKAIYLRNSLITFVAVAPASAVMAYYHSSENTPILLLIPAIGLGVVAWSLLVIALRHPLRGELAKIFNKLVSLSNHYSR